MLSRREFCQAGGILSLGAVLPWPELLRPSEPVAEINVTGNISRLDPRLRNYQGAYGLPESPEVATLNDLWKEHLRTQLMKTPFEGEGAATRYGLAAVSTGQVLRLGEEINSTPASQRTEAQSRILSFYTELINSGVLNEFDWNSAEFSRRYSEILFETTGAVCVLASKSSEDYGRLMELEVYDPLAEKFISSVEINGAAHRITGIVLDTANGDTFRTQMESYYPTGLYGPEEEVVAAWVADASSELHKLLKVPGGHRSQAPLIIRWSEVDGNINATYPDYKLPAPPLSDAYKEFGENLKGYLAAVSIGISLNTSSDSGTAIEVNSGTYPSLFLHQQGVPLAMERVDLKYPEILSGEGEAGIPLGNINLGALLEALSVSGQLDKNILSANSQLPIPASKGVFSLEIKPPDHDTTNPLVMGIYSADSYGNIELRYFYGEEQHEKLSERNGMVYDTLWNQENWDPEIRMVFYH